MVPSVSSLRPSEYDPVRQFLWADSSSSRRSIGGVGAPGNRATASARAIINSCGESSSEIGWPAVTWRARLARIEGAFRDPYVRERPRDPEEACLLRERGTPEHLIGPESKRSA